MLILGDYFNYEICETENVRLVHSDFDMNLLTKSIPNKFKDKIKTIIINENLFKYITKIRKDKSFSFLNNKIDLIKQEYISLLNDKIKSLN